MKVTKPMTPTPVAIAPSTGATRSHDDFGGAVAAAAATPTGSSTALTATG